MKTKICIAVLTMSLAACNSNETQSPMISPYNTEPSGTPVPGPSASPTPKPVKPVTRHDLPQNPNHLEFSVNAIPNAKANDYFASIRWSWAGKADQQIRIERFTEGSKSPDISLDVGANKLGYVDTQVQANQNYEYQLSIESTDVKESKKVKIPVDYVVTKDESKRAALNVVDHTVYLENYNRLFFETGAVLEMGENNLELNVNEIVADHAQIQSYSTQSLGDLGTIGKNAGNITIKAKKFVSTLGTRSPSLSVSTRGQCGGSGVQGQNGADGYNGANGAPGSARPSSYGYEVVTCPGSGQNGGDGGPAENGKAGATGGQGGNIRVSIQELDESAAEGVFYWDARGGKGGEGGAPGAAGKGGIAGNGGIYRDLDGRYSNGVPMNIMFTNMCYVSPAHEGKSGQSAMMGISGAEGEDGAVCIQWGNKSAGCKAPVNSRGSI